jgi:putative membrane protein
MKKVSCWSMCLGATACVAIAACGGSGDAARVATPVPTASIDAAPSAGPDIAPASSAGVQTATVAPSPSAPAAPPPDAPLNDGQIAGIASRVDLAEIDAGKLALQRGKSAKAKQFAQHMVTAHTAVEAKLTALLKAQKIVVGESPVCDKLTVDTSAQKQTLIAKSGADFDRAYLSAQLQDHQDVLDLLDNKLIPQAQNPQLKAALEDTRKKVVDHIQMAKDALATLPAP